MRIFSVNNKLWIVSVLCFLFYLAIFLVFNGKDESSIIPMSFPKTIKPKNKWIVVTSVSKPTEDIKRLASFKDWNLVVVADTKTPIDWNLPGVHFLSVDYQKSMNFSTAAFLPFKSYTRKNIGYLYAISRGAEWIYDTDDDNKPYGLGLEQFDYDDEVSGMRFQVGNEGSLMINRLFNPYRFFGMDQMWPRGFPLEFLEKHTNGNASQVLCRKIKRAAVQQGLVHHDPDVDAIYRLMHADLKTGLDVKFNKFGPPITLSVGTYSPWNSQNTLFHKSAFHTLFLPTTVSFRTTDIWRSFVAQKILHLSGLSVSFVPTNAVQFRNAHDYLKDFKDEKQVYEDSGRMLEFLHNWKCSGKVLSKCVVELGSELARQGFWGQPDADLLSAFIKDLQVMGFEFPAMVSENYKDPYKSPNSEETRDVNCRRMSLSFELKDPKMSNEENLHQKSVQKLDYFGELSQWCNESGYSNLSSNFPSPQELTEVHNSSYVLQKDLDNVLVVVNNYAWTYGVGVIQRLYQPYFGAVIFCGSWYPDQIVRGTKHTDPIDPIHYIHMNPSEIMKGYFAYHCLSLARQMRLSNVNGYFLMADDAVFNIWQRIDYSRVHHLTGVTSSTSWWKGRYGLRAATKIVEFVETSTDETVLETWKKFEVGLKENGHLIENRTAFDQFTSGKWLSISDFYYIPTSQMDYYSRLMTIFYDHQFFQELAVNRFLQSVRHQTSLVRRKSYLWENRNSWNTLYDKDMVAMHPVKLSAFQKSGNYRKMYCASILQTWSDIVFGGSQNFTIKNDGDADYLNG